MHCCLQKDFLDTKYDVYRTPEQIATDRGTLFTFANAFYTQLPNGFTALDNNLFAAASDEAQQTSNSAQGALLFNQGILSSTSNLDYTGSSAYRRAYNGIRAANFYLDYSKGWRELLARNRDTITDLNYTRDKLFIQWFRGEAHIARAYYYFELTKRYGGVPIMTSTLDKSDGQPVAKSSFDEVVNYIVSEIDLYKDSLQVNWKTSSYKDQDGRFSKGAALALKSRVLLYAASPLNNPSNDVSKWQKAAAAANDVRAASLGYGLYTGGYGAYFLGSTPISSGTTETILAVRNIADNNPERANYPITTPGGNSGIAPSHNLVSAYEYIGTPDATDPYKNRDPRLAATVVTNGSIWNGRKIEESAGGTDDLAKTNTSRTGYYLKKFLSENLNLPQDGTAQHNWVLFRYAEILLNYAEAMNEAYGPDDANGFGLTARQALTQVRNRASTLLPAVTTTDKALFRAAVKQERRVELAFEDHRYWDLLRWKDAETVLNQPIKGVRISKNLNGTYSYQVADVSSRSFKAPMYLFPFAQYELVNSKGTLVQNTGY